MTPDLRLSVVIPTYNRREALARILLALQEQTLPACDFEVVVSIDGSVDGTRELLGEIAVPYRLSALWRNNAGRASACNAGARQARGELLLFFDDDMLPAPECLAAHLAAHRDGARRAVLGAIPFVTAEQGEPLREFLSAKVNTVLARLSQSGYSMTPRDFFSSNFSIGRDLFFELGGFDGNFRAYGNEDVDLAFRIMAAGVPIVFHREALARQCYDKDFAALARDTVNKGRTAVQLALKHPQALISLSVRREREFSRKWRLLRSLLLGLPASRGSALMLQLVDLFERRHPRSLGRVYPLALDYFFWLGVRSATGARSAPWPEATLAAPADARTVR